MKNQQVIINIIENNRQIQKIHTTGKRAFIDAKEQLEEKYIQQKKKE